MPKLDAAPEPDLAETTAKLNEGLKSCRSLVQDYRRILGAGDAVNGDWGNARTVLEGALDANESLPHSMNV